MDTLEPYVIVKINKDKITKKLIDIFNEEIPEVGIIRLIYNNFYEFKIRTKKLNLIQI